MVRYTEQEKEDAVRQYYILMTEGSVFTDSGEMIHNVRDLCAELNISKYSLYDWNKKSGMGFNGGIKPKPEPRPESVSYSEVAQDVDMFGIRFWGFVGKNLKIPNYASIPLNQLKLKVGLKLIEQTGLVDVNQIRKGFAKK